MYNTNTQRTVPCRQTGFVALISVIIISAALLGLSLTAGMSGFFARFASLDRESKKVSQSLAEACVHSALLAIAQNYNYTPGAYGESVAVDSESCNIVSVAYGTEDAQHTKVATITTRAEYHDAFTTLLTLANVVHPTFLTPSAEPVSITSVEEI